MSDSLIEFSNHLFAASLAHTFRVQWLPMIWRHDIKFPPCAVLEAMALRCPIISTNTPGCYETVVEGDNDFLPPVEFVNVLL